MKLTSLFVIGVLTICGTGRAAEPLPVDRKLNEAEVVCAVNLCYELAPGTIQVYPASNGYPETLALGTLNRDTVVGDLVAPKGSTVSLSHPSGINIEFLVGLSEATRLPHSSNEFAANSNVRVYNYNYSTSSGKILANSYLVYSGRLAQDSLLEGYPASHNSDVAIHLDAVTGNLVLHTLTLSSPHDLGKIPYLGSDLELAAGDRLDFYGQKTPSHVWFATERVFTDNLAVSSASFSKSLALQAVYAKSSVGFKTVLRGLGIESGPIWMENGRIVAAFLTYQNQIVEGVQVQGENLHWGNGIFFHDNGRVMRVKSADATANRLMLPPTNVLPTENGKPITIRDVAYAFDDQGQIKAELILSGGNYRSYFYEVFRDEAGSLQFKAAAVPTVGGDLYNALNMDQSEFHYDKLLAARAALAAYVKR